MFTCTRGFGKNSCVECISHFEADDELVEEDRFEYSYLSRGRCCPLGYVLGEGICEEIDTPNCILENRGKCQKCDIGY